MRNRLKLICFSCRLHTVYSETPVTGPDAKRVKVCDIQQCFAQQFPCDAIAPGQIGWLVIKAFLNAQPRRVGHERNTFIVGIEQCATSDQSSQSTQALLQAEKAKTEQLALQTEMLEARVCELEQSITHFHCKWKKLCRMEQLYSMARHSYTI